jgi:hypothetical protein
MLHHKNVGHNLFMKVKLMRSFLSCTIEATWKTNSRSEGNIKIDHKQIEWKDINWVFLDKQRIISISREALLHGIGLLILSQHLHFAYRNITLLLAKSVSPFIHICYPTSLNTVYNHKHACTIPCNMLQTLQVYLYVHTDCFKWFLLPPVSDSLIQYGLVNCIRCMHFL